MQLTFEGKTIDQLAIELIQAMVGKQKAYATLSGGVDSTVEVDLVRRSGVAHELHYHVTGLDAPETIRFIRDFYPDCIFDRAPKTFWQGVMTNGFPMRNQRWCCAQLKECFGLDQSIIIDGIRQNESNARKARNCFEPCNDHPETMLLHPIFKWSRRMVWQYIDERHLPHNPLYYTNERRITKRRIGCLLCPNCSTYECKRQMKLYPGFTKLYLLNAERYVQKRIERGTPLTQRSGEEYFNWWIKR
jgi:3'-phosphoadenosine 5'-phosphosulfate sulfotransferase (PAPS reductase)/FAD synthetase